MIDTTMEMVPIEHIPITPPRKDHDGERSYLELWRRYISRCTEEELQSIFRNTRYAHLTQRQASVAASFVIWLGTNCGRGLITEADHVPPERDGYRQGRDLRYLRRWELENRRELGINGGVRYIEAILDPARCTRETVIMAAAPDITIDDLDVIECLCRWLATMEGQYFIKAGEARMEALARERYLFGEP